MQPQNFVKWGLERSIQGDWYAALQSFDQALWIDPLYVDAYIARGTTYHTNGNFDQALVDFNHAIELDPQSVLGYYNRGCTYLAQNQVELSLADFRQAIVLDSQFLGAYQQLAVILYNLGRYTDSIPAYAQCLALEGESAELYHSLGTVCRHAGRTSEALRYFQQALTLDPYYIPAREEMQLLYQENVQNWHYWMMNDTARNLPYQEAINHHVTPQTLVLEIGTGSGLLAMMAAKAGAAQVITCEGQDLIAERARQIIQVNGFQDQIRVINKLSRDLVISDDLPELADILITEIFGAWLPSEGALEAINHALSHLLKPSAKVIPSGANLYLMPIECLELHQRYWVDQVVGFDLSSFNEFQYPQTAFIGQIDQHVYRALSDPYCFAQLDFCHRPMELFEQVIEIPVLEDGMLHAFCTWFDLLVDDNVMLTTGPIGNKNRRSRSWGQLTPVIYPALRIQSNETLKLHLLPSLTTIEVVVRTD